MITIRRAEKRDFDDIVRLLRQVLEIHVALRPDIFVSGGKKYSDEELLAIIGNDEKPVFVADNGARVVGYAFCIFVRRNPSESTRGFTTLFVDDLCVDESCRGQHIGEKLFEHVKNYAKNTNCYDVALNVWEGNDAAKHFYAKMGMFPKETQMEFIL